MPEPMEERLLAARRFEVIRRTIPLDDGTSVTREYVVHPGAVVIVPLLPDGRIVMIRQIRDAVGEEIWELPAGTREDGEEPIVTAGRELIEETGYRAGEIEPLTEFFTSPGIMTERMVAFVARDLEEVGQQLERGERIRVERVPSNEVKEKLVSGEIKDGKTIAALAVHFLKSQ